MSTRGSAARTAYVFTGDAKQDDMQAARNDLARKVGANPLANAVKLEGLLQTNGSTTDGIAFAAGATVELAHGLGRAATGFAVLDALLGPALLYRVASSTGLEETHIRLTQDASAPRTIRVRLAVF
jgi:hypothetical protein